MKIAFDYGLGVNLPREPPTGGIGGGREPIMVIRSGSGRTDELGRDAGIAERPDESDGIPVPGTDLVLSSSDEARARDAEVRLHESAHLKALGSLAASGANLAISRGPDGETHAVGGSVKVDISPVPGDPESTLRKARTVINAALAPGDPSAADMRVAAEAYRMAADAKGDLGEIDLLA